MSFASEVKNETTFLDLTQSEKIAELAGFARASGKFFATHTELYTENSKIAKRMFTFIKDIYRVNSEIIKKQSPVFNKKSVFLILIKEKSPLILKDLSIWNENGEFRDQTAEYIIGSIDEMKSYIRGSFYGKGSINDPKTSQYHLEFLYERKQEAVFVQRLLNEFNLNAKILIRDKKYMVYIKDSDDISDFLKIIGASQAVMYYENVRVLHQQMNITNRLNNCEQANVDKILLSCQQQIHDIEVIKQSLDLDVLDEKLIEAATYRLKYPEASLLELSSIISIETNKKITKSGLNHRFRKIREIATKVKENREQ